jgi:hypothetical protein
MNPTLRSNYARNREIQHLHLQKCDLGSRLAVRHSRCAKRVCTTADAVPHDQLPSDVAESPGSGQAQEVTQKGALEHRVLFLHSRKKHLI